MKIPLPLGFSGLENFPRLQENLINCFNPDNKIVKTPGIAKYAASVGFCRGMGLFKDEAYAVNGAKFTKINDNNSVTVIDDILGAGDVVMAPSFAQMAITEDLTGSTYVFDGTTLTDTTGTNSMPLSRDVAILAGRAIYVPQNGDPLAFSELNDFGNVPAANFFDAESLPDVNVGIYNLRDTLYVLGSNSIEQFRAGLDPNNPFIKVSRGASQSGYVSGKTPFGKTFAFLGRIKDGSYSFYVMDQSEAIQISTPEVDELLQDFTLDQLSTCRGMRFKWKGYEILAFELPGLTFCFVNGRWFFMESGVSGPDARAPWIVSFLLHAYGKYVVASARAISIGTLEDINTEVGANIVREVRTFARSERGSYFNANTVTWDGRVGVGTANSTIGMSVSKDGETWSPELWRDLGEVGDYQRRIIWIEPGGLGFYESFMGLRFRITDDVDIGLDFIEVDFD